MSVSAVQADSHNKLRREIEKEAFKSRWWIIGSLVALALYFVFSILSFIPDGKKIWFPDRASLFVLDTYAYKEHVDMRWDEPGEIRATYEGGRNFVYSDERTPEWLDRGDDQTTVNFDNGGSMSILPDRVTMDNWPGTDASLIFSVVDETPTVRWADNSSAPLPEWVRVTESKIEVRPSLYERLQVYKKKLEIHRYELGWAYFFFDFNSPLADFSLFEALGTIFDENRIDPKQSNFSLVTSEIWLNEIWLHQEVMIAMVETIFMALIGTMVAAVVSLPLAFAAARNIMPFAPIRFFLRRFFDLLRGIDVLIWSLIFLRAFGPGMFTGIFAIAFTDTGTLGKLFSEAIENTDNKQKEGIQSTGASRVQQQRFGIVPQILPIFISQSLYYLESNTRGAVIIGAMGAGGIGLMFLGYLQTGTSFENVAYISILVLITVIVMDFMSAKLRRALIGMDGRE